jgi:orotidine-5'-phosphate decarboxylase
MNKQELIKHIYEKKTFLCIGLDVELEKLPKHLFEFEDPILEFNKQIIDATHEYCVAFKPNTAFYEQYGLSGWNSLEKTIQYIKKYYPKHFVIADAKRGDIGNTSKAYAKTFFETLSCDAVTVAPYMGSDSVLPFLSFKDKWTIILAHTSNIGALDFQTLYINNEELLYENVLRKSSGWGNDENTMYVVGATKAESLKKVREIIPHHFLLVPGVGAQGGSLEEVVKYGIIDGCGLLVNSSRGIIYASNDSSFALAAAAEAKKLAVEMSQYLS